MADALAQAVQASLITHNTETGHAWTFGTNWDNQGKEFETYVNKYLFPKLNETLIIESILGNRFNWLAKEVDFIGQYSEEYVILDSVPIELDLSKNAELMLKRNYPKMATKLYGQGILKKLKFTLNNNDTRLNFLTIGDAITYAVSVYRKKITDINVAEEAEMKAMLVDYGLHHVADTRTVNSMEELFETLSEAILNLQNNSAKHNEASTASGGALGRFTTNTKLSDMIIITTDKVKRYLLNTFLANTFHAEGIDLSKIIISFDDLGGAYRTTADITVTQPILNKLQLFGDYQVQVGDVIPKGYVFTYDVSDVITEHLEEIKPDSDLFAMVLDARAIRYKRYTKGMLKQPFYNGEFDEVTYWIHYYSFKAI
ncbi:MAG: hypothetical protein U0K25_02235, partial [Streptococcus sp.]|nr:hypothetical protein [Streptococcus sp.]